MKQVSLYISLFFSTCLMGCHENTRHDKHVSQSSTLVSELDTIIIEKDTIRFFTAHKRNASAHIADTLLKDGQSYKEDSGYTFILHSGRSLRLRNNFDDGLAYKEYTAFEDMKTIDHWLLYVTGYEWRSCELISKSDGRIQETIDYPVLSPKKDKIIVAKTDLDAQLEFNGIQLLKVDHGRIREKWIRELKDIGLRDPHWITNDTVVFTRENARTHQMDYVKACFK